MTIIKSLIGPATKLLDKFIEDKDQKNALAHEIATMAEKHAVKLAKGQMEINKTEAAHKSLFVAGWRPFIGWTCGVAMLSNFLLIPMANFILDLAGSKNVSTINRTRNYDACFDGHVRSWCYEKLRESKKREQGKIMENIIRLLRRHEGVEPYAYKDHLGYITVGVGRCLEKDVGNGLV